MTDTHTHTTQTFWRTEHGFYRIQHIPHISVLYPLDSATLTLLHPPPHTSPGRNPHAHHGASRAHKHPFIFAIHIVAAVQFESIWVDEHFAEDKLNRFTPNARFHLFGLCVCVRVFVRVRACETVRALVRGSSG